MPLHSQFLQTAPLISAPFKSVFSALILWNSVNQRFVSLKKAWDRSAFRKTDLNKLALLKFAALKFMACSFPFSFPSILMFSSCAFCIFIFVRLNSIPCFVNARRQNLNVFSLIFSRYSLKINSILFSQSFFVSFPFISITCARKSKVSKEGTGIFQLSKSSSINELNKRFAKKYSCNEE